MHFCLFEPPCNLQCCQLLKMLNLKQSVNLINVNRIAVTCAHFWFIIAGAKYRLRQHNLCQYLHCFNQAVQSKRGGNDSRPTSFENLYLYANLNNTNFFSIKGRYWTRNEIKANSAKLELEPGIVNNLFARKKTLTLKSLMNNRF